MLIQTAYSIIEKKFKDKKLKLNMKIADDIEVCVEKTSFVNTVINNLLTNAVKFSYPDSQIEIFAEEDNGEVIIQFQDYGIGIPETLKNNLFDVTKSTSRVGTGGEIGTGFGMPLVEKFLQANEGIISIESKCEKEFPEEHGTVVTVTLKPCC